MTEQTSFGLLTTVEVPFSIVAKDSSFSEQGLVLANYIFKDSGKSAAFDLCYTLVDHKGEVQELFKDQGVMPQLFLSPCKTNFTSMITSLEQGKCCLYTSISDQSKAPFVEKHAVKGNFVGTTNQSALFFEVDIWNESALDHLYSISFENSEIQKIHKASITAPKSNMIKVSNDQIHLITECEQGWLHRQIDAKGKELKRRVLDFEFPFVHEALSLSFEESSYLLCEENGEIGIVEIDAQGQANYSVVFDIKDEFFGTWLPKQINETTTVTQFTTEFGNGWIVVKQDELVELVYNKNKKGYVNLLTGEKLSIDDNNLVVSSISAVAKDVFAIVFHPRVVKEQTYNKLYVLQHKIS